MRPDPIKLRKWDALPFRDAKTDLINLAKLQARLAKSHGITPEVANLRERDLRQYLQWRQAALFCYLVQGATDKPSLAYTVVEDEDYDALACWTDGVTRHYAPIQLKEIVPQSRNPTSSLDAELSKLTKYSTSHETVVAFHVNRAGKLDEFLNLEPPKANVREIWFFGALSPDQRLWFLYGDLMKQPRLYELPYPTQ
jgi:hypothetical protein